MGSFHTSDHNSNWRRNYKKETTQTKNENNWQFDYDFRELNEVGNPRLDYGTEIIFSFQFHYHDSWIHQILRINQKYWKLVSKFESQKWNSELVFNMKKKVVQVHRYAKSCRIMVQQWTITHRLPCLELYRVAALRRTAVAESYQVDIFSWITSHALWINQFFPETNNWPSHINEDIE